MSPASRLAWNLKVLQRHDSTIHSILDQVSYAVLYNYNFDTNEDGSLVGWEKRGVEGSMFIYERKVEPRYGFFILNRNGIGNFIQTMSKDDDLELTDDDDYIIFRSNSTIDPMSANQSNLCVGLWIFEQVARRRIADYMMELHALIQNEAPPISEVATASAPAAAPATEQSQPQAQPQSQQPQEAEPPRPLDSLFSRIRITSENLDRAQPLAQTAPPQPAPAISTGDGDGGGGGSTALTGDVLGALLGMLPRSATNSAAPSTTGAPSTKGAASAPTHSSYPAHGRTFNKTPLPRTPSPEPLVDGNGVDGDESPLSSFSPRPPSAVPAPSRPSVFDAPKVNGSRNRQPLRERTLVPFDMSFDPIEAPPSPSRFPSQQQHRRNMTNKPNKANSYPQARPVKQTYTPVNTKPVSKLEREEVQKAVVDVFGEADRGDVAIPPRNDFVRELLTLIHTDSKFVDELYATYVRKVES